MESKVLMGLLSKKRETLVKQTPVMNQIKHMKYDQMKKVWCDHYPRDYRDHIDENMINQFSVEVGCDDNVNTITIKSQVPGAHTKNVHFATVTLFKQGDNYWVGDTSCWINNNPRRPCKSTGTTPPCVHKCALLLLWWALFHVKVFIVLSVL